MKELLFINPVFNIGKNVTVRRGIKWSLESYAYIEGEGKVTITNTQVIRAQDILPEMIKYEHDPKCRKVHGLLSELKDIYPNFDPTEIVTIVEFVIPCDITH